MVMSMGIGREDIVENRFVGMKSEEFMKLQVEQFLLKHIGLLKVLH